MRLRLASVALVVGLMVLAPVAGNLVPDRGAAPDAAEPGHPGGGRSSPWSEVSVNFSVRNPSVQARGPEIAWFETPVPRGVMPDKDRFAVFDRNTGRELRAGVLQSDVSRWDDDSISRIRFHFKDRWSGTETKDYRVVLGRTPHATGPSITTSVSGEFAVVNDGARQYQVHMDDSVRFSRYTSVYYLYILNGELRAHGSALTRVGGNQLDPDQASFQMWWGLHTDRRVEQSPLLNRIHLEYDRPEVVHWGPGGSSIAQIFRQPDLVRAELDLTFYQGIPRIDVHSRKVVNERFWNHNGFVMEFSAIRGGGADWQGEFETVFGTDQHIVMTTTNRAPTWSRRSTTWQDIDVTSDAAPALADLDGDGDVDMLLGSEHGNITAWENVGTRVDADMVRNASWEGGLPSLVSPVPALGDVDGDGDADMVVGDQGGKLKVYRNEGGASGPPSWNRWWGHFDRLGLGHHTAPCLGDADGDGDLDILVGLWDGTLRGFVNTGTSTEPRWRMDNGWTRHLSYGAARAPTDAHSAPHMADMDYDGDPDLLLGSDDGKVTHFENTGSPRQPSWDRLELSNYADMRTGSPFESNSTIAVADVDGDGDRDVVMGTHRGTLHLYTFEGNTSVYRGHNNLQPLLNGTYRHMRDKDGNDGPFVVEGYGHEWYGYYVLANPRNGYAAMRYIPDFDRLAYRQEYWGDEFPYAGGNVSYYPYDQAAREYVTRAQITSNAMSDGVSAGTFISQTGTSAGFVMQPMTAMTYESDETLLMDLTRSPNPWGYDPIAEVLGTPLEVLRPVNLRPVSMWVSRPTGGDGEPNRVFVQVANQGEEDAANVSVQVEVRRSNREEVVGNLTVGPLTVPGMGSVVFEAPLDTWSLAGWIDVVATVDPQSVIVETLEGDDNVLMVEVPVLARSIPWSEPTALTTRVNTSLNADAIVRPDGLLYAVWETCQGEEEIDIEGRSFDPATGGLGPHEALVSDSHYAVSPDLALVGDSMVLGYSSNIEALRLYHRTAHGKYYWGEKFDLWVRTWESGGWKPPTRVTRAVDYQDSDQTPDLVHGAGALRMYFRNTHFQFYTNGNQMDNVPFQEMDVREATWTQSSGWSSGNTTMSTTAGSQAWWGGPQAAAEGDDRVWVVYATEVGNSQWDLYAEARGTGGLERRVQLARSNGANEVRPSIASGGADPSVMVVYERERNGDRDIVARWRSPGPDPGQGWSRPTTLSDVTDALDDMKPAVACDGNGSYWVAWESARPGNKDIFVSRFDGTDWHGPYQATTHPGSDEEPVLACDAATGRVYLVWETDRNGMGNKDIYMRHWLPSAPDLALEGPLSGHEDSPLNVTGEASDADDDLHHVTWDWGDGNMTDTRGPEANHTYTRAGGYTVRVWPVDRYGLAGIERTVTVTVSNVRPTARLEGPDQVDEDAETRFSACNSTDTPSDLPGLSVEWDFGDGTSLGPVPLLEAANQTRTYTSSGTYGVVVTITDDDGDAATAALDLTVRNLPPTVTASTSFDELEEGEEGVFTGQGNDTPSDALKGFTYVWEWGDGTTSGELLDPMAGHAYNGSGSFVATLHVYDDDGDEGKASVNVTVLNLPPSVEAVGPAMADEDEEVVVTARASDTPFDLGHLEYRWDWGDGSVSGWTNLSEATHTYEGDGTYYVTVTVRDDDGEEATFTIPLSVENLAPVARASADRDRVPEGAAVHLSAEGSTDTPSDVEGLSYVWDLGTELVEGPEVDHAFQVSGLHTVTLTVTDDDGDLSRATVDVMVVNRPPVARGTVDRTEVRAGEMISLDASTSSDDPWDAGGLTYRWRMGDGTALTGERATHVYALAGTYRVELVVTDGDGDRAMANLTVTVLPQATGDGDGDGGGLSSDAIAVGIVLVVVVVMVSALLVVRLRRIMSRKEPPGTPVVEEEGPREGTPPEPELEEEPGPEPPPEVGEGPSPEVTEETLEEEAAEVLRPKEQGSDPEDLLQRIKDDLDLDED